MTSLRKAAKAVAKGSVLVATITVRPANAHAPTGSGCRTRPAERSGEGVGWWDGSPRAAVCDAGSEGGKNTAGGMPELGRITQATLDTASALKVALGWDDNGQDCVIVDAYS